MNFQVITEWTVMFIVSPTLVAEDGGRFLLLLLLWGTSATWFAEVTDVTSTCADTSCGSVRSMLLLVTPLISI